MEESAAAQRRNLKEGNNNTEEKCGVCFKTFQRDVDPEQIDDESSTEEVKRFKSGKSSQDWSLESFNHLSSYFHHEEGEVGHHRMEEEPDSDEKSALPKLIYTLITRWSSVCRDETGKPCQSICVGCHEELSKLDELHQRLQSIKQEISCQVKTIKDKSINQQNLFSKNKHYFWKEKSAVERVCGSSSGYANVSCTLRFLGSLCDNLEYPYDVNKVIPKQPETGTGALAPLATGSLPSTPNAESLSSSSPRYSPITPQVLKCDPSSSPDAEELLRTHFEVKTECSEKDAESGEENVNFQPNDCDDDNLDFSSVYFETATNNNPLEEPVEASSSLSDYSPTQRPKKVRKKQRSSSNNSYKCQTCQKIFGKKATLQIHERIHSGSKPYQCHLCPMRFTQNGGLSKHMVTHTGEKKYHCTVCNYRFTQGGALRRHMKLQHHIN